MFADAHISSLGNLCFFSLISEEEGEPWDEDAQQKRKSSLRKISSPLAPQDGLTLRLSLGGLKKVKFSQGYVKGNYVGDPSGTFHVRMGQYEGSFLPILTFKFCYAILLRCYSVFLGILLCIFESYYSLSNSVIHFSDFTMPLCIL